MQGNIYNSGSNLSIEDTTGTQLAVLHREVPLIQRYISAQLCVVGTVDSADSSLELEVSCIQSVVLHIERFLCIRVDMARNVWCEHCSSELLVVNYL